MKIRFINSLQETPSIQEVQQDTGVQYLSESKKGFFTLGVSSCLVFVGYYKNKLSFMSHVSTPGSKEDMQASINFIDKQFSKMLWEYPKATQQQNLRIFALGGQESSQKTIEALRAYSQRDLKFKLNVKGLHLAHHEDYFDLLILKDMPTIYLKHHIVCPRQAIKKELKLIPNHPAPLLFAMGFIASHQPELTLKQKFSKKSTKTLRKRQQLQLR